MYNRKPQDQYYKVASHVLSSSRPQSAVNALLEAAETGDEQKVKHLIKKYRTLIDQKCTSTGDTALITASRCGHNKIVEYLLKSGADPTLQNDAGETALKVATLSVRDLLLANVSASSGQSNAHELLQSAWLGDAVRVKKTMAGNVIDVNCRNSEGLTPLLLVTRDIGTFEKVHHVMKSDYDPLQVMQELFQHNADASASDSKGRSALHLISSGEKSVQAKKVVSLLLKNGGNINSLDHSNRSPLHAAAASGHTAIIVALLEEGNADINQKGGDKGDTPLMLSAREGHKETAQYLLSKGADVTIADDFGDTALTVAKTPSMVTLLKEAWNEQTTSLPSKERRPRSRSTPGKPCEESDDEEEDTPASSDDAFFITQQPTSSSYPDNVISRLESVDPSELNEIDGGHEHDTPEPMVRPSFSEAEADDEQDDNMTSSKRSKPATKRLQVRHTMQESLASKRSTFQRENKKNPAHQSKRSIDHGLIKKHSLDEDGPPRCSSQSRLQQLRGQQLLSVMSRSMESLPSSERRTGRSTPNTPTSTTPTCNTPTRIKRMSLPAVSTNHHKNMSTVERQVHVPVISSAPAIQAVALLAIDAEKEKLQVQEFHRGGQKLGRSQSLQNINKQSSMPHVHLSDNKATPTKVPLLPAVIMPQLPNPPPATPTYRHGHSRNKFPRLPPTGTLTALTVVNEDTETSSSSERTLTNQSARDMVTPTPDTVSPPTSNTMINYAVREGGDEPLSPIWNSMQFLQSDVDTTSCGEYITSYVGSRTPFPLHFLSQEGMPNRKVAGADSGHEGESDDGKLASSSSEETGNEEENEEREKLKWKKGKLLGRGAYGKVWEGLMDSAKLIAVKEVELDVETADKAKTQFEKIQLEVDILRSLSHRNIVRYWGAAMEETTVYIFMEYISGGSLQSILKRFGSLDERTICHYTRQITRGLEYLHQNGVIHRDIKGANIMVTSKGVVKLIDFGCAKRYCQELSMAFHSVRGTPYWMAPEVICGRGYGRKSDIWSLACTIYEMVLTKPPWGDLPPEAAMFQIGIGQTVPQLPGHLSNELRCLFSLCLTRDPAKRPTASEVLENPFFSLYNSQEVKSRRRK